MERASTVIAHATLLSAGVLEHANVVFPAESYAEKEGTVTHPDGRLQRVRQAVARAGSTRPGRQVLVELCEQLGFEAQVRDEHAASQLLFDAVPFYSGLTLEQIGGRGVRWQEREAVAVGVGAGGTGSGAERSEGDERDIPAQVTHDDSYTESARGEQTAPSAEAHSGPDRETHAADTQTEGEDSDSGEPPPAKGGRS
jgi:NADH dehydrogenase/NADH:ubiquinone oxidoreductase subunit G